MPETVVINCNDKKAMNKMNCYILHTFLLVTILLLKAVALLVVVYAATQRPNLLVLSLSLTLINTFFTSNNMIFNPTTQTFFLHF